MLRDKEPRSKEAPPLEEFSRSQSTCRTCKCWWRRSRRRQSRRRDPQDQVEKKRLEEKVRKLELSSKKAAEDDDEEEEEDDDDDDMSESRPLSKAELGRSLAGAEADQKYAAGRLNASPKSSGYLQMLEEAKKRVANINEALRKLKDPADQLRHKSERLQNLADQEKKLLQKLRTGCQVIGDAEAEVATLRERIHE